MVVRTAAGKPGYVGRRSQLGVDERRAKQPARELLEAVRCADGGDEMRIRGLHGRLRAAIVATALIAGGARAAPTCKGLSTSPVAFGSYNPVSATPTDSVGTISYFCPGALSPVISI